MREGVAALFPEPGGTRLAPKEQEARHEKLLKSLDELEAVLEALQLGARARSFWGERAPWGGVAVVSPLQNLVSLALVQGIPPRR